MSDPFELIVAPSSRSEWQEAGRFDLGRYEARLRELYSGRKGCECSGTSSGPRFVLTEQLALPDRDAFEFGMALVGMACDICNAPWVRDDEVATATLAGYCGA
jgi:hypothetical protein